MATPLKLARPDPGFDPPSPQRVDRHRLFCRLFVLHPGETLHLVGDRQEQGRQRGVNGSVLTG